MVTAPCLRLSVRTDLLSRRPLPLTSCLHLLFRLGMLATITKELNSWHAAGIQGPWIRGEEITHAAINLAQTFGNNSLQISLQC